MVHCGLCASVAIVSVMASECESERDGVLVFCHLYALGLSVVCRYRSAVLCDSRHPHVVLEAAILNLCVADGDRRRDRTARLYLCRARHAHGLGCVLSRVLAHARLPVACLLLHALSLPLPAIVSALYDCLA